MEPDVAHDPPDILFLGTVTVVALADLGAYAVEKAWFRSMLHNQSAAFDDIQRPWSI